MDFQVDYFDKLVIVDYIKFKGKEGYFLKTHGGKQLIAFLGGFKMQNDKKKRPFFQDDPTVIRKQGPGLCSNEVSLALLILAASLFVIFIMISQSFFAEVLDPYLIALCVAGWLALTISTAMVFRWVLGLHRITRDISDIKKRLESVKDQPDPTPIPEKRPPTSTVPEGFFKAACPECLAKFTLPDKAKGKNTTCPKCQAKFVIT